MKIKKKIDYDIFTILFEIADSVNACGNSYMMHFENIGKTLIIQRVKFRKKYLLTGFMEDYKNED